MGSLQQLDQVGAGNLSKLEQSITGVGLSTQKVGLGLTGLGAAILAPMAAGVKGAMSLEQAFVDVQASMDKVDYSKMAEVEQMIIDIGASGQYSALEIAAVTEELVKGGFAIDDILSGDPAKGFGNMAQAVSDLASATGSGLGPAVEGISAAMNIWSPRVVDSSIALTDAAKAADIFTVAANASAADTEDIIAGMRNFGPVAAGMGIGFEDAAAAIAMFTNYGLKARVAGTALSTAMQRLAAPTGAAADTMKELGISAWDSQGSFIGMPALFNQLRDKMSGMTDEAKMAALTTIFGAEAMDVMGIAVLDGADSLDAIIAQMEDYGIAGRQAFMRTQTLSGALERLSEGFFTMLAVIAKGAIAPLTWLANALDMVTAAIMKLPDPILQAFGLITMLAGGIATATGSFLLLAPRIREFMGAMRALSLIGGPLGTLASVFLRLTGFARPFQLLAKAILAVVSASKMLSLAFGGILALGIFAYDQNMLGFGDWVDHQVSKATGAWKEFKALFGASENETLMESRFKQGDLLSGSIFGEAGSGADGKDWFVLGPEGEKFGQILESYKDTDGTIRMRVEMDDGSEQWLEQGPDGVTAWADSVDTVNSTIQTSVSRLEGFNQGIDSIQSRLSQRGFGFLNPVIDGFQAAVNGVAGFGSGITKGIGLLGRFNESFLDSRRRGLAGMSDALRSGWNSIKHDIGAEGTFMRDIGDALFPARGADGAMMPVAERITNALGIAMNKVGLGKFAHLAGPIVNGISSAFSAIGAGIGIAGDFIGGVIDRIGGGFKGLGASIRGMWNIKDISIIEKFGFAIASMLHGAGFTGAAANVAKFTGQVGTFLDTFRMSWDLAGKSASTAGIGENLTITERALFSLSNAFRSVGLDGVADNIDAFGARWGGTINNVIATTGKVIASILAFTPAVAGAGAGSWLLAAAMGGLVAAIFTLPSLFELVAKGLDKLGFEGAAKKMREWGEAIENNHGNIKLFALSLLALATSGITIPVVLAAIGRGIMSLSSAFAAAIPEMLLLGRRFVQFFAGLKLGDVLWNILAGKKAMLFGVDLNEVIENAIGGIADFAINISLDAIIEFFEDPGKQAKKLAFIAIAASLAVLTVTGGIVPALALLGIVGLAGLALAVVKKVVDYFRNDPEAVAKIQLKIDTIWSHLEDIPILGLLFKAGRFVYDYFWKPLYNTGMAVRSWMVEQGGLWERFVNFIERTWLGMVALDLLEKLGGSAFMGKYMKDVGDARVAVRGLEAALYGLFKLFKLPFKFAFQPLDLLKEIMGGTNARQLTNALSMSMDDAMKSLSFEEFFNVQRALAASGRNLNREWRFATLLGRAFADSMRLALNVIVSMFSPTRKVSDAWKGISKFVQSTNKGYQNTTRLMTASNKLTLRGLSIVNSQMDEYARAYRAITSGGRAFNINEMFRMLEVDGIIDLKQMTAAVQADYRKIFAFIDKTGGDTARLGFGKRTIAGIVAAWQNLGATLYRRGGLANVFRWVFMQPINIPANILNKVFRLDDWLATGLDFDRPRRFLARWRGWWDEVGTLMTRDMANIPIDETRLSAALDNRVRSVQAMFRKGFTDKISVADARRVFRGIVNQDLLDDSIRMILKNGGDLNKASQLLSDELRTAWEVWIDSAPRNVRGRITSEMFEEVSKMIQANVDGMTEDMVRFRGTFAQRMTANIRLFFRDWGAKLAANRAEIIRPFARFMDHMFGDIYRGLINLGPRIRQSALGRFVAAVTAPIRSGIANIGGAISRSAREIGGSFMEWGRTINRIGQVDVARQSAFLARQIDKSMVDIGSALAKVGGIAPTGMVGDIVRSALDDVAIVSQTPGRFGANILEAITRIDNIAPDAARIVGKVFDDILTSGMDLSSVKGRQAAIAQGIEDSLAGIGRARIAPAGFMNEMLQAEFRAIDLSRPWAEVIEDLKRTASRIDAVTPGSGGAASDVIERMFGSFDDARFTVRGTSIQRTIAGMLNRFRAIPSAANAATAPLRAIPQVVSAILGPFRFLGTQIANIGRNFNTAADIFGKVMPFFDETAKVGPRVALGLTLASVASLIWAKNLFGMKDAFGGVVSAIGDGIGALVDAWGDNKLAGVIDKIEEGIGNMLSDIPGTLSTVANSPAWDKLFSMFAIFGGLFIGGPLGLAIGLLAPLIANLAGNFVKSIGRIAHAWDKFGFDGAMKQFGTEISKGLGGAGKWFSTFGNQVSAVGKALGSIPGIGGPLEKFFTGVGDRIRDFGFSILDLQWYFDQARAEGLNPFQAGVKALSRQFPRFGKVLERTNEFAEAFGFGWDNAGKSMGPFARNMGPVERGLQSLSFAFRSMGWDTAANVVDGLSESWAKMQPSLSGLLDPLNRIKDSFGLLFSGDVVGFAKEFGLGFRDLAVGIGDVLIASRELTGQLVDKLFDGLAERFPNMKESFEDLNTGFQQMNTGVSDIISGLQSFLNGDFEGGVASIASGIGNIWNGIGNIASGIWTALGEVDWSGIGDSIATALGEIDWEAALKSVGDAIMAGVGAALLAAKWTLEVAVPAVSGWLANIGTWFAEEIWPDIDWDGITEGLRNFATSFLASDSILVRMMGLAITGLANAIDLFREHYDTLSAVWSGVVSVFDFLMGLLPDPVREMAEAISQLAKELIGLAVAYKVASALGLVPTWLGGRGIGNKGNPLGRKGSSTGGPVVGGGTQPRTGGGGWKMPKWLQNLGKAGTGGLLGSIFSGTRGLLTRGGSALPVVIASAPAWLTGMAWWKTLTGQNELSDGDPEKGATDAERIAYQKTGSTSGGLVFGREDTWDAFMANLSLKNIRIGSAGEVQLGGTAVFPDISSAWEALISGDPTYSQNENSSTIGAFWQRLGLPQLDPMNLRRKESGGGTEKTLGNMSMPDIDIDMLRRAREAIMSNLGPQTVDPVYRNLGQQVLSTSGRFQAMSTDVSSYTGATRTAVSSDYSMMAQQMAQHLVPMRAGSEVQFGAIASAAQARSTETATGWSTNSLAALRGASPNFQGLRSAGVTEFGTLAASSAVQGGAMASSMIGSATNMNTQGVAQSGALRSGVIGNMLGAALGVGVQSGAMASAGIAGSERMNAGMTGETAKVAGMLLSQSVRWSTTILLQAFAMRSAGHSVGYQLGAGVASGIDASVHLVNAASARLIAAARVSAGVAAAIRSPSRLFRDEVGYQLGAGTAVGIMNSIPLVNSAIGEMMDFSRSLDRGGIHSGRYQSSSGGGSVTTQYIDNSQTHYVALNDEQFASLLAARDKTNVIHAAMTNRNAATQYKGGR